MQYPTTHVLARLRARAEKLRAHAGSRETEVLAQFERAKARTGERVETARDQLNKLIQAVEAEDYGRAADLAYQTYQALNSVPRATEPDLSSVHGSRHQAEEIDGLVELIGSTGADKISTGELEKLQALRFVR